MWGLVWSSVGIYKTFLEHIDFWVAILMFISIFMPPKHVHSTERDWGSSGEQGSRHKQKWPLQHTSFATKKHPTRLFVYSNFAILWYFVTQGHSMSCLGWHLHRKGAPQGKQINQINQKTPPRSHSTTQAPSQHSEYEAMLQGTNEDHKPIFRARNGVLGPRQAFLRWSKVPPKPFW